MKIIWMQWTVDRESFYGRTAREVVENIMKKNEPYMKSTRVPNIQDFMRVIADRVRRHKSVTISTEKPEEFLEGMCRCGTFRHIGSKSQ